MYAGCVLRVVTSFVRNLCRSLRWVNVICVALSSLTLNGIEVLIALVQDRRPRRSEVTVRWMSV